ncbi:MAG TPA: pyridoxamine 5'-phosphate oxidase [Vicinamibacterales bacterium]|jgi:pyridoxamine 5'-phosphate oxidase
MSSSAESAADPISLFEEWFSEAVATGMKLPEAMALATATRKGAPSVRMVLLRGLENGRFAFFTNYQSRKGRELERNPHASLLFHWPLLERQVRIEGAVRKLTRRESQAYFQARPRESQLAAWASRQSSVIPNRELLEAEFERAQTRFAGKNVPCPPFWGGYQLVPAQIEFWQAREHRLHDRRCYEKQRRGWKVVVLAP